MRSLDDAVEAAKRISELGRARCREVFEQRFTSTHMATDYLRVYEHLACGQQLHIQKE